MTKQLGLATDRQRAIWNMNKAFALYEHSERIFDARNNETDWVLRHIMTRDASQLHMQANNAAGEAERFFNRC